MTAPVPPLLVPGWIIDCVLTETANTVVVAARGAEAVMPPAQPQFVTIRITRPGHEQDAERELEALVACGAMTEADIVHSTVVMWDGHGVAARVLRARVDREPEPAFAPDAYALDEHAAEGRYVSAGEAEPATAPDQSLLEPWFRRLQDRVDRINERPTTRRGGYVMVAIAVVAVVFATWSIVGGPHRGGAPTGTDERDALTWDAVTARVSVEHEGQVRSFELGEPGDDVMFGDWEGDGVRTPALYRRSTGELWFFSAWATADTRSEPTLAVHAIAQGRPEVQRHNGVDVVVVHPADAVRPRSG